MSRKRWDNLWYIINGCFHLTLEIFFVKILNFLLTAGEDQPERPLSAENLLPEPNIASMTSSNAASMLSSVLQGNTITPTMKCLTRQQTFPPPQPYMRMRYMSATAEMTTCQETAHEGKIKLLNYIYHWRSTLGAK